MIIIRNNLLNNYNRIAIKSYPINRRFINDKRFNAIGIQMLSEKLHKQIFGEKSTKRNPKLEQIEHHLRQHSLWNKDITESKDVDFKLPTLFGNNIDEHFRIIANKQIEPYILQAQVRISINYMYLYLDRPVTFLINHI